MAELTSPSDEELMAGLEAEVDALIAQCRASHALRAERFFVTHRQAVLQVALAARKEPKKRDLPSPFVYSMQ